MIFAIFIFQFYFPGAVNVLAQDNSDCLTCHSDETLEKQRGGKSVSLYIDEKKLLTSSHARLSCVSCHADLKGKDLPHEESPAKVNCGVCHTKEQEVYSVSLHGKALARGDPLAPLCQDCHGAHDIKPIKDPTSTINCGVCHIKEQELYSTSLHGRALARGDRLAPRCQDCHGAHDIISVNDPTSVVAPLRIPLVCGTCHREGAPVQRQRMIHQGNILENYSESIHGEGLLKKGLVVAATCASCHTAHEILPHTDPRSSIARKNIAATCAKCHAMIEQVHRKIIKGELWEKEGHVLPACVDCHQPHKVRKVFYDQGMADRDCLVCHEKEDMRAGDGRSLYVNTEELSSSRHTKVACSQCHSGVNPSHRRPCEGITSKVDCSACHAEVVEQYQQSRHGQLFARNDPNAPSCLECHGRHRILGKKDSRSTTFPINVPDLCARCHREGQKAALRYTGKEHEITSRYAESIHGKGLLKSGLVVTAMCTDCHTAHRELPHNNPESSVYRDNVPKTCGRCHHGIQEQFVKSVHSPEITKTGKDLPICSDCHTAHTIRRADEAGFRLEIMNTCGRCHTEIAKTYFDTYHGKVSQLGYVKTAKCYDCHGAHDILPVEDPRSSLSRDNVIATCRKCHPGSTRRFAGYLTHATHHDSKKYPWLFWTFWGMTVLLISVFIIGGLHTLLWLPRAIQLRRSHPHGDPDPNEKQFVRFSRLNRTLHIVMIVSFLSLALTGMTLKFSYTGWAATLSRLLGGFESAGYIHRVAAVMMISIFMTHVFDLVRRKRKEHGTWRAMLFGPNTMLPTRKDLSDFWDSVKWFLGLGDRPRYGRWTYWEKFDYFAVFWGIAVIGSTGLLLWFAEFLTRFMPGWLLNVATIIHSDEALLAVGFIFTIHFFNTHLRPEKFPMDIVIFTGRMPVEELQRDKPLEYETLVKDNELEEHLGEPYQPIVIRTIRVFAWTALAVGFSIVVWIIYAMIFAYR